MKYLYLKKKKSSGRRCKTFIFHIDHDLIILILREPGNTKLGIAIVVKENIKEKIFLNVKDSNLP